MNMPKKVGIILINYQNYAVRFLAECRDSLRRQDYPAESFCVYVIDNASTPETENFLRATYPEAELMTRADGNYAAANNLGFRRAIADGCDYLVTVNMDTEMEADWLSQLVIALDGRPEAAIAQSKVLLYPRGDEDRAVPKINSLGNIFHFLGFGFTFCYGEPDRPVSGYPEINGYASGCSFIIRAAVWEAVGGYNEEFYMYHDDVELSLKVRLSGHKIILAPRSVIRHKYEFDRSVRMLYYIERNRVLTLFAFYPLWLLILITPPALAIQLGLLLYAGVHGWLKTSFRVYAYFLCPKNYVKLHKYRREIKRLSTVPFSDLAGSFSGRIEFQEIANPLLNRLVNPVLDLYWNIVKRII